MDNPHLFLSVFFIPSSITDHLSILFLERCLCAMYLYMAQFRFTLIAPFDSSTLLLFLYVRISLFSCFPIFFRFTFFFLFSSLFFLQPFRCSLLHFLISCALTDEYVYTDIPAYAHTQTQIYTCATSGTLSVNVRDTVRYIFLQN